MLKIFNVKSYQDRVDEIYAQLLKDCASCSIRTFEHRMRRIHILNSRILFREADYGRSDDIL